MSDRARLAVSVSDGRGHTTRLGHDEVEAGNLLQDLSYSSSAPGGHKEASFSLLRDLFPRLDEAPFNRVSIYGPGGGEVWSGRYATLPRQTGQNYSLSPSCVGMQAHLLDDSSFMEVYADRDTSSFQEPPLSRRAALAAGGANISPTNGVGVSADGGALVWDVGTSIPAEAITELWYTAPGSIRIKAMEFNGVRSGSWTGFESPTLFGFDTPTTGQISTVDSSFGLSMHEVILTLAKRHAMLRVYNASAGALTPAQGTRQQLSPIAVYGGHGLPRYFYDNTQPSGVKGHDVVANIVARAAPLLNFTTGTGGTIRPTGNLIIPHLVFKEPTTAAAAIQQVNKFYGWDWLVWGDTFYYQPAGSGTVWQTRRAAGGSLNAEGPNADSIYNGVRVTFTDLDGLTKMAGPPMTNTYDYTSSTLVDTSDANPVNAAGIPRKWLAVDLTGVGPMWPDTAIQLGQLQLAEANAVKRTGTITVQGLVEHSTGHSAPVGEIRAGDSIVFSDLIGYAPQRIDEVSYSHSSRTATLGINAPLSRSESLLERLQLASSFVN